MLQQEFTKGEFKAAMEQIDPLKSPGPDGFGACFYQLYWSIIGDEVYNVALNFLRGGEMMQLMNFNRIALILIYDNLVLNHIQ